VYNISVSTELKQVAHAKVIICWKLYRGKSEGNKE